MNNSQELPQEQGWPANVPVPTFRHSSLDSFLQEAGFESEQQGDKVDAFLLYSNDEIRMRTISGGVLGADQESTSAESNRKTRISFELHPSVFIEDLLLADDVDDSLNHGDTDSSREEAVVKASDADSHMNALVSYLFGEEFKSNIRVPRAA